MKPRRLLAVTAGFFAAFCASQWGAPDWLTAGVGATFYLLLMGDDECA